MHSPSIRVEAFLVCEVIEKTASKPFNFNIGAARSPVSIYVGLSNSTQISWAGTSVISARKCSLRTSRTVLVAHCSSNRCVSSSVPSRFAGKWVSSWSLGFRTLSIQTSSKTGDTCSNLATKKVTSSVFYFDAERINPHINVLTLCVFTRVFLKSARREKMPVEEPAHR